ncbi:energy-coupling factor transporter transmembrane component T [Clostridium oceanicum]|uniref:Energy-coupling factor transporter transmembrane component T n=1 Tax=Clostridium oceanicum TaxID=1543 RepID=A0ABP3UR49_9CLOT
MITYDENNKDSLLYKINPIVKVLILVITTTIITFDYKPYSSIIFFGVAIFILKFLGRFPLKKIIRLIAPFFIVALSFFLFTMLTRGLTHKYIYDFKFYCFTWRNKDIILSLALGFRILAIITYSIIFVVSTNPVDFILSLIAYLHLPYKIGYSILTAYRFLPTFTKELESIRFAHEIRGIKNEKGFIGKIKDFKKFVIPMLATAIRRGERISIAMEARAFGISKDRTYYRKIKFEKLDGTSLILSIIFCILLVIILQRYNLMNMGIGFNFN